MNLIVCLARMPLLVEYWYVLEADCQELGRLGFAGLIMVRVGSYIKSPALTTLLDDEGIPDLVALDHALEVEILSETGRALIGGVR